ncbi:hypothetical protein OBRU01_17009 [Operophtera brumata]|uniref:Uncharacterized protein n=1 Tax=Operophtera brumata TaxID=104452 RepID=A0A0L7L061_OPEBR|nr:hypothetical protein OBRU01_17009 [Operophtera brumata]
MQKKIGKHYTAKNLIKNINDVCKRCKINEKPNTTAWTTIAHNCVDKYNDTEHTITGFAPRYLLDGTDVSFMPDELKQEKQADNWIKDRKIALERSIKSHEYNKKINDKNRTHHNFEKGDMVYVENGHKLNRRKLDELRIGPFKIEEKISQSIYKISTGHRKKESNLFHITKLIPVPTQEDNGGAPIYYHELEGKFQGNFLA